VHLFGIQNEVTREQLNYVLDEDKIIGKRPNGTLSLIFDSIKKLKITCDNAGEQNKYNTTTVFDLFIFGTVTLSIMITL
jgi:hypothetical protein